MIEIIISNSFHPFLLKYTFLLGEKSYEYAPGGATAGCRLSRPLSCQTTVSTWQAEHNVSKHRRILFREGDLK